MTTTGKEKDSTTECCYLCGSSRNTTRDHVPPKGFFPRPRPSDLITVPCCYTCNHTFHRQDELLRLFLSGGINRNPTGHKVWQRVLNSTVAKGRLRKNVRALAESMTVRQLPTPRGTLQAAYVTIPQEEIVDALVRIAKGILYHHVPDVPRNDLRFRVVQIDQLRLNEVLDPILRALPLYRQKGDGAFRYWGGLVDGDKRGGLWVLMFYDSMAFAVFHEPAGRAA